MTAAERLSELIRVPTVSAYSADDEDAAVFERIPGLLEELYPRAHRVLHRELVGDRGLLYRWDGRDSEAAPILGLAHYDVVPPGDPGQWSHPPFSGAIVDRRIHGRGSLDDKGMLAAWMEAVERLAERGFQPRRSLYLAFGGDEETTGVRGAGRLAAHLAERGLRFACVLDEGGAVAVDQLAAFTDRPVALIGAAEKGYLTLRLVARGMPGHASSPPKRSAVGRLSSVLHALEARPSPSRMADVPRGMLRALGRAVGGLKGFVLSHPGLFRRFLLRNFAGSPATAGMVRTTVAPTVVRGGERDNVLPETAEAAVNVRILPGESVATVIRRIEGLIAGCVDEGVEVEPVPGSVFEPVPSSPVDGPFWELLSSRAEAHWPGVVPAPYLMTGTTDSRWYRDLSDAIYRFIPMEVSSREMSAVHAPDESISLDAWERSIAFLEDFIAESQRIGGHS